MRLFLRALVRTPFQEEEKYLEGVLYLFKMMCLEAPWYPPAIQETCLPVHLN